MNWRLKSLGLIVLFLMIHQTFWGQKRWLATTGSPIQTVDLVELEVKDRSQLASTRSVIGKEVPFHFAHQIVTDIPIQDQGTWEHLDNGNLLWRQRIRSQGAYSLNLAFKDFYLPSSAVLFLYDVD